MGLIAMIIGKIDFNSRIGWKRLVLSALVSMVVCTIFLGAFAMTAIPDVVETVTPSVEPLPTATPIESEEPDITPGPFEMTEKQTFASVDTIENDLNNENNYIPKLSVENEAYLFLDEQTFLHHGGDVPLTNGELFELIRERFNLVLHSVTDFPASEVNGNSELSSLILDATDIDMEIKQAIATNRISELAGLYDELIQIYQIATTEAPRGEYFLQLGRPYYEKALYMKRVTGNEKNEVFHLCAQAINAYRTSATYERFSGETDADLLYRIAAVYHYLGDTPSLSVEYRIRLYRLAIAYLSVAEECATANDDYYGYISYYKGMVLHKLAIASTNALEANTYLVLARSEYELAPEQRSFNDSLLGDLNHALKDIDYRLG